MDLRVLCHNNQIEFPSKGKTPNMIKKEFIYYLNHLKKGDYMHWTHMFWKSSNETKLFSGDDIILFVSGNTIYAKGIIKSHQKFICVINNIKYKSRTNFKSIKFTKEIPLSDFEKLINRKVNHGELKIEIDKKINNFLNNI